MRNIIIFIIIVNLFGVFSCQQSETPLSDDPDNDVSSVGSNPDDDNYIIISRDRATFSIGEYELQNNVWGKDDISDYAQSIFYNKHFPHTFGWEWSWPDVGNNVKAYPEIIFGKKPWRDHSTTSKLPLLVSDADLTIDIETTTTATGKYNTSFDIWLTGSLSSDEADIKVELMIWLNHQDMLPGTIDGVEDEAVSIDGENYKLYVDKNFGEPSGETDLVWTFIAFEKEDETNAAILNLKSFLAELLDRGIIKNTWFVSSIELGNEIVAGTGRTEITRYSIKENTGDGATGEK